MSLHDVTIPLEKRQEIYENKGERHYVWPRRYLKNGILATCESCLYYKPYEKSELYYDGECGSVVQNARSGYVHRLDGNDRVQKTDWCHCFFWKDESGEQMTFGGETK